ncbi:MAG: ATP-binding protein [Gammaproteobacteria bacterium]|nr:ATP-binding protein [Gammaproteobacteria bacterium]
MKIRTKLSVTYLTVSLLSLVVISVFIYLYVRQTLTAEVLSHLESVSSIQAHRVLGIIEQNLERLRLVSSRTQLRISLNAYLQNNDPAELEKIQLIINDALESTGSFKVISILDKNGVVIASTNPDRVNHNYATFDFYTSAQREYTAEHFFLDEKNESKIYLSGPLMINENLLGILLIESDAENFVSLISDYSGLRQTGETVLGKKSMDGQSALFLAPLRFDQNAALKRSISLSNHFNPMVIALSKKESLLTTALDYRGAEVLAATNYISKTGWGLVVKMDKAEAFAATSSLIKYILLITLSMMFLVVWVSFAFAKIISNPIVELTKTAHDINEGDLYQRALVRNDDEIGELAGAFNNMANNLILTQHNLENTNKELQSHREHLEEMVSQRTLELQEKNKELESFAYSVSHDLRSPLRAIDGFSRILQEDYEDQLDDNGKTNLSRIRQASQRMGRLIDDLLELSRINRSEIVRQKIDLSSKVQSMIARLENTGRARKVDFMVQPDVFIYADDVLMDVVIANLIGNAWKYTGKKADARIEFGKTTINDEAVYYVRDNGIGFDMKYANKLFGAFQRLVGYDEYPGTGIGLATVLRVISRHGGRIWAEGDPGKGATFYFTVAQAGQ